MASSYLEQHPRRAFGDAAVLLPVVQGAHTDAHHGGKLHLGQAEAFTDAFDVGKD